MPVTKRARVAKCGVERLGLLLCAAALATALAPQAAASDLRTDILRHCREVLPSHKVPATINFVPALAIADTGKLIRFHA